MNKDFLDTEFDTFKNSASKGYKIAKLQHGKLTDTIKDAIKQIQGVLDVFKKSKYMDSAVTQSLSAQLIEITKSFEELEKKTNEDILRLQKSLSLFSITLFGRTMAGKSTLMEFFTHGEGKSIGKGSQRTTRDVRKYEWNKLSITDVPGIGAFEGQKDETVAFNAAKNGDVILFLITDDAPQYAEAECLSKIINIGKPVIIILNVKSAIAEGGSIKLALRDIEKKFDKERIEKIKQQFRAFAAKFGQDWNHIPIVSVHLKSAYMSQNVQDKETQEQLYKISRIDFLQKVIVNSVKENGNFYRIKNFIDIINTPMLSSMETLLEQSNQNSSQARIILEKKRNLEIWKNKFQSDSENRICSFIANIKSNLYGEVASFAENHYDDKNAGDEWKHILEDYKLETKSSDLLNEIESKCNEHIAEIAREISSELEFSNHIIADKSLNMQKIIDGKRIWDWSTLIASGSLGIAAAIAGLCGAAVAGPLGLAAFVVAGIGVLFSFLFTDKDAQISEARQKLELKLKENVNTICKRMEKTLKKCLAEIVEKRIDGLCKEIQRILNVMFSLSNEQKRLAWNINHRISDINEKILESALILTGFDGLQYHVKAVARIPGQAVLIELPDGTRFPNDLRNKVQKLMREEVSFVFETDNKWLLLARILGKSIDRNTIKIKIEEKIGVAHVPIEKTNLLLVRQARLAQQLTELLITR